MVINNIPQWFRHGDIILTKVSDAIEKPENKKLIALQNQNVIAEGEETGHHHRMTNGQILLYADQVSQVPEVLNVESPEASLVHEEHKELTLEKGTYEITRENTFNVFEQSIERVRD